MPLCCSQLINNSPGRTPQCLQGLSPEICVFIHCVYSPSLLHIWSALKVWTRWLRQFPQILLSSYIFSTGVQMALCRQAMWSMVGNVDRHVTCVCFRKTVSFIPEEPTRQGFIKWHIDYICEWKCNIYYCDCMFSLIHPVSGMKATWFLLCFTQGTWKGCTHLKDDSVKTLTLL